MQTLGHGYQSCGAEGITTLGHGYQSLGAEGITMEFGCKKHTEYAATTEEMFSGLLFEYWSYQL